MLREVFGDQFVDGQGPKQEATKGFYLLMNALARLIAADELFTFVQHTEADGTNNGAERGLRGAATDRRIGRTSKTPHGAQRKTIISSILESLKLHLDRFHLASVIAEVITWRPGESLFTRLMQSSGLSPPNESTLQKLVPTE